MELSSLSPALSNLLIASNRSTRLRDRITDFIDLTRPRVLVLVLLTAPPAFAMGHAGWPSFLTMFGVVLGAALIGAGSGAINAWWERELDGLMERTQDRPLPSQRLTPTEALLFGVGVSLAGLLVLHLTTTPMATAIGAYTLLHYVLVYTIWAKPRSPQNIVIGGIAGAAAPLIADAAVDGRIGVWGLVLFAIVFIWQPPHFWAITLYRKREYEAAGFPMMPSVVGNGPTRKRSLAYAILLLPVMLLPWFGGVLSGFYAATAFLGGSHFIYCIVQSMREDNDEADRRVFRSSIICLGALFLEMTLELCLQTL